MVSMVFQGFLGYSAGGFLGDFKGFLEIFVVVFYVFPLVSLFFGGKTLQCR